jgi:hypothetical protein
MFERRRPRGQVRQRAIVAVVDGAIRGLASEGEFAAVWGICLYKRSRDAVQSGCGRLRGADGEARRRGIEMLIWVDMPKRSRLLEGEIVGVHMGSERGPTVEAVRTGHLVRVRLDGGQHEAELWETGIDGPVRIVASTVSEPEWEGGDDWIEFRRQPSKASLHAF